MVVYQISSEKKGGWESLSLTVRILLINVLFFIVSRILVSLNLISLDYFALNPANILHSFFVWTFLTSMFMHANIFHLFVNMLSLLFVGTFVEKLLGKKRYLGFYLLSGLFAGFLFVLSALIFPAEMNTYAVGASGAIFGLIGILVLLTPNLPVYMMFIPIPIKMKYAAPGMLILLWLISLSTGISIGNVAHFGGLLAGIFYGLYLKKYFPNKTRYLSKRFS